MRALAERFAPYATGLRHAIAHAAEVEDAGSAALYTDLSRGVDQQLGDLDAHLHRWPIALSIVDTLGTWYYGYNVP